jgi:hypothetical protein
VDIAGSAPGDIARRESRARRGVFHIELSALGFQRSAFDANTVRANVFVLMAER